MGVTHKIGIGDEVRQALKRGVDLAADTAKVTLGPRGRNVVLDTNPYTNPVNTNDGVRIVREVQANDAFEKIGVRIVKEVAEKTNDIAGDGTTTASLLTQEIINNAMVQLANGVDAVELRNDIERAAGMVVANLKSQATPITSLPELINVATISCGNAELGKIVAEVVYKLGADGVVTIEDGETDTTTARMTEGIELRGGFLVSAFINQRAKQESHLDDVPVFVTDQDITTAVEVAKMMEACAMNNFKRCVLIANNITGEALVNCVLMWNQKKFEMLPIRVQAHGEMGKGLLKDVAIATGATFYAGDEGYRLLQSHENQYDFNHFGRAARVIATKDRTTIIDGAGKDAIAERVAELQAQANNAIRAFEADNLKERAAKLRSGVGVITVGGIIETEKEERKYRIEDAINACKAALEAGIVSGGGTALYRSIVAFDGEIMTPGNNAIMKACQAPLQQMIYNGALMVDRSDLERIISDRAATIDMKTGTVVNALEAGIIDPVKVVSTALINAAQAAALFVITERVVTSETDTSEKV